MRRDARHDLVRNWRAGPGLVAAVNALFGSASRPFLLDGIPFPPAEAARVRPPLTVAGDRTRALPHLVPRA